MASNRLNRPRTWVEVFVLLNLGGLAPDIFLAHSVNGFHSRAEYVPLFFSLIAPVLLLIALAALFTSREALWRQLGFWVGGTSVLIGIVGLVLHLKSQFFQQWTLASLVYAAPFAAPLAYTGLGSLLVMNRMVPEQTAEWAEWVLFFALGGFAGNFIFSLTDHAQNGFFHRTEWIPVISSAVAVGFLLVPLVARVNREFLRYCGWVMAGQAVVGAVGFTLHALADWRNVGENLFLRIVHGAPVFAPTLFCDLAVLAAIGLWVMGKRGHSPGR
jgi:preprotein translocase subunit Sss1